MQFLNNLFKVGRKKKGDIMLYADVISFFATGKCQKIWKINENG